MKIIVTQKAKNDRLELFDYNSKISLKYAIRIDKKIGSYIKELKTNPYIGRYVPEILDNHYRERICEKFRIIYFVSEIEDTIFVRYIFCARLDKTTFFELHKKEIYNFLNHLFD